MPKPASCQELEFGVIYTEDKKNDILSRHINMIKKILLYGIMVLVALAVIALLLSIKLPIHQSFRVVFGLFYAVFIPGYIWSYVFFKEKSITAIERFALSITLSITVVPLIVFLFNKIMLKINIINLVFEILLIIITAIIIICAKRINLFYKFYEKN